MGLNWGSTELGSQELAPPAAAVGTVMLVAQVGQLIWRPAQAASASIRWPQFEHANFMLLRSRGDLCLLFRRHDAEDPARADVMGDGLRVRLDVSCAEKLLV